MGLADGLTGRNCHAACAEVARSGERCVDVLQSHLDELRDDARHWRDLIGAHVREDDGAVRSDAQLGAVGVADAYSFPKPKADSSHATAARTSG
jgi:hypothetical protein